MAESLNGDEAAALGHYHGLTLVRAHFTVRIRTRIVPLEFPLH